jgi:hypothetical protein
MTRLQTVAWALITAAGAGAGLALGPTVVNLLR